MAQTSNDLNISQSGMVAFDGVATFSGRTITGGAGITVTNGSGVAGDPTIALTGGSTGVDTIFIDNSTAPGTNPVVPNATGEITITGGQVANASLANVIQTHSFAANSFSVTIQRATTAASTNSTKNGVCHFNSTNFSVDSNGFVSIISGGFTWTDVTGGTQTLAVENGYLTDNAGGVTYTLPATASIGDEIKIVGKLGLATITPNANQQILMGSTSGAVGVTGTAVATNVGDCVDLICTTSGASTKWRASNWVGNWTVTT